MELELLGSREKAAVLQALRSRVNLLLDLGMSSEAHFVQVFIRKLECTELGWLLRPERNRERAARAGAPHGQDPN